MTGNKAAARKSVKRTEYRLKGFIGTLTLHGQCEKSVVNGLSCPTAENTEKTYRIYQSHNQLLQHEMRRCF